MGPAKSSPPPCGAAPRHPDALAPWRGFDHVQLAIPVGGEPEARRFYSGVLGLTERAKPPALAVRGGAWFEGAGFEGAGFESGATRVHLGVDPTFVPARKAHPALLVAGLRHFVARTGLDAVWSDEVPGVVRCHVHDPFGNRIELIEALPDPGTRSERS